MEEGLWTGLHFGVASESLDAYTLVLGSFPNDFEKLSQFMA